MLMDFQLGLLYLVYSNMSNKQLSNSVFANYRDFLVTSRSVIGSKNVGHFHLSPSRAIIIAISGADSSRTSILFLTNTSTLMII